MMLGSGLDPDLAVEFVPQKLCFNRCEERGVWVSRKIHVASSSCIEVKHRTHVCTCSALQKSFRRRQHQDKFPLTLPKPHHIPIPQLEKPARLHPLPIHPRPIRALQINQIRSHPPRLLPKLIRPGDVPELQHGVLFRNTRVLEKQIRHVLVAPEEPDTALADVDRVEEVFRFEDVEAPVLGSGGFARFGGFVVFEDGRGAGDGVGLFGEEAGGLVIGFLLGGAGGGGDTFVATGERFGLGWERGSWFAA